MPKGLQSVKMGAVEIRWLAQALRVLDFFSSLTIAELERTLPSIVLQRWPEGSEVIREGERGECLFVLYKGRAVVTRRRKWRLFSAPVASLLPGDFFGEMALINHLPRAANVATTEDCLIFAISEKELRRIIERNPSLAERLENAAALRKLELEYDR